MNLLLTKEIRQQIAHEIEHTATNLHIITAYCKKDMIAFLDRCIKKPLAQKHLLVRFLPEDILSGATDFDIYDYARRNGWKLYVRFDLHAKTYIFDSKRCLVGSANITRKGLAYGGVAGNYEHAVLIDIDKQDMAKIKALFHSAVLLDDTLYEMMRKDLEGFSANHSNKGIAWRPDIIERFMPKVETLFSYDFPNSDNPFSDACDRYDFINLPPHATAEKVRAEFRMSRIYQWLIDTLQLASGELYFGALSKKLHGDIVQDPKPYRREIKQLLHNLLSWVERLELTELTVDQPNHSQRVSYQPLAYTETAGRA